VQKNSAAEADPNQRDLSIILKTIAYRWNPTMLIGKQTNKPPDLDICEKAKPIKQNNDAEDTGPEHDKSVRGRTLAPKICQKHKTKV
jgi:hypothetical protein